MCDEISEKPVIGLITAIHSITLCIITRFIYIFCHVKCHICVKRYPMSYELI